jgi:hypothetical protein
MELNQRLAKRVKQQPQSFANLKTHVYFLSQVFKRLLVEM